MFIVLPISEVYTEVFKFDVPISRYPTLCFTWGVTMVETYWLLEWVRVMSRTGECEEWRGK